MGPLSDVFTAAPEPQAQLPAQLQDQKLDYMKSQLASLYQPQAPENRFSAIGMFMPPPQCGYGGVGIGPGGYATATTMPSSYPAPNPSMQFMASSASPSAQTFSG